MIGGWEDEWPMVGGGTHEGSCGSGAGSWVGGDSNKGVGEGSMEHYDPALVFPMMVLSNDGGCVIWLRLGKDDSGSW